VLAVRSAQLRAEEFAIPRVGTEPDAAPVLTQYCSGR
jgi:hypothetical protein